MGMIVVARRCCRDQTAPGFFGEKGWEERARDCLEDTQLRLATIFGMLTTLLEPYACRHLHAGWGMLTTTDGLTSLCYPQNSTGHARCCLTPQATKSNSLYRTKARLGGLEALPFGGKTRLPAAPFGGS
jgi:hypothetical protein